MSKEIRLSKRQQRRLEREQEQLEREVRQRDNRTKFIMDHLSSKYQIHTETDSAFSVTTFTEDELSDIGTLSQEELFAKFLAVEEDLWQCKLECINNDHDIFSSLPPILQKAYRLGYKEGYLSANQSIVSLAKDHKMFLCLSPRTQAAYHKGFTNGYNFWQWMWAGI